MCKRETNMLNHCLIEINSLSCDESSLPWWKLQRAREWTQLKWLLSNKPIQHALADEELSAFQHRLYSE